MHAAYRFDRNYPCHGMEGSPTTMHTWQAIAATLIAIYLGYSKLKLVEDGRLGSLSASKVVNQTGEELWQKIAFIE